MNDWATGATATTGGLLTSLALNFVTAERRLSRPPPRWYGFEDPDFRRATGVLLGPAILPGNNIRPLVNGDEIFPAMLEAIARRQDLDHVRNLSSTGRATSARRSPRRSSSARRAGVPVHVLLDWVGSIKMEASCCSR